MRITHIVPGQQTRVRCTAGMVERDAKAAAAAAAMMANNNAQSAASNPVVNPALITV